MIRDFPFGSIPLGQRARRSKALRPVRIKDFEGVSGYSNQSETNHNAPARAIKGPIKKKPCSAPRSKPSRHSHSPANMMRGAINMPATRCDLSFIS
jgi:hypothetical protein